MKNKKTGFTLIELLVVIAVIGILAATLLVGYSGVRDRAKDARAIAGMSQLRVAAESFYPSATSYLGLNNDTTVNDIIADINKQVPLSGAATISGTPTATGYCAQVTLNDNSKFCVDAIAKAGSGTCVNNECVLN